MSLSVVYVCGEAIRREVPPEQVVAAGVIDVGVSEG